MSNFIVCRIIRAFETIAEVLVTQDNFTNITITGNDIALRGERVNQLII